MYTHNRIVGNVDDATAILNTLLNLNGNLNILEKAYPNTAKATILITDININDKNNNRNK